mmetsp:Transcript_12663/g.46273  ORF Transcript_12663/g.46273 Transcript_12663/m.46273 type:complete len:105 (+) Transcript_12663:983-1297(+)|eukprot:scaffold931_cov383-Prasinococcus_capsulatus_cf.AAC.19
MVLAVVAIVVVTTVFAPSVAPGAVVVVVMVVMLAGDEDGLMVALVAGTSSTGKPLESIALVVTVTVVLRSMASLSLKLGAAVPDVAVAALTAGSTAPFLRLRSM